MEIITFLKMAWPLIMALIVMTGIIVKMQTKISFLCGVNERLQGHAGEFLTFMNQYKIIVDNNTQHIKSVDGVNFRRQEKSTTDNKEVWTELDRHGNRLTSLESKYAPGKE